MASSWEALFLTVTGLGDGAVQLLCALLLLTTLLAIALNCLAPPTDRVAAFVRLYEDTVRREFRRQPSETHAALVACAHAALAPAAALSAAMARGMAPAPPLVLLLAPLGTQRTALRLAQAAAAAAAGALLGLATPPPPDELTVRGMALAGAAAALAATEAGAGAAGDEGAAQLTVAAVSSAAGQWRAAVLADAQRLPPAAAAAALLLFARSVPHPTPRLAPHSTPRAMQRHSPRPLPVDARAQALLVVVMSVGDRFSREQLRLRPPCALAETFLEELWGGRLEPSALMELKSALCARAVVVREEDPRPRAASAHFRPPHATTARATAHCPSSATSTPL